MVAAWAGATVGAWACRRGVHETPIRALLDDSHDLAAMIA